MGQTPMARKPVRFEGTKRDNDRGVREGSKADKARDAKERARKSVADKGKVEIAAYRRSMPKGKK